MQNNCPVCYSLSWDQKPFNTKVGKGAVFTSKCTRNCLAARHCPDPLGNVQCSLISFNWILGVRPQGRRGIKV